MRARSQVDGKNVHVPWQLVLQQKVPCLCCIFAVCCLGTSGQRVSRVDLFKLFFPPSPCDRYGHFSGINRKVQLTYLPHGHPKAASEDEGKET